MIASNNATFTRKAARPHASNILNNDYQFRSLDRTLAMRYMQALREGRIRGEPPLALQRPMILTYRPRMDLFDSPSSPVVAAVLELPGLKKQDINLRVEQGQLVVSGERRCNIPAAIPTSVGSDTGQNASGDPDANIHIPVQELKYGKYLRVIPLPPGIMPSQINATLGEGLLTVTWPRGVPPMASDVASDMDISLHSAPKSTHPESNDETILASATSRMHMDGN